MSDVEVVDDYPSSVLAHARRRHRWVRGDWQILQWMFPFVRTKTGIERNRLPIISRWKIADNLRRSLVPPSMPLYFVAAWTALPGSAVAWTLAGLLTLGFPLCARLIELLAGPEPAQQLSVFGRTFTEDMRMAAARALIQLTFLANEAFETVHAIGITLLRLAITGTRLLEWETADSVARRHPSSRRVFLTRMTPSPAIAAGAVLLVLLTRPSAHCTCNRSSLFAVWTSRISTSRACSDLILRR